MLKKYLGFLLFFLLLSGISLSAQGKVEGSAFRLKGGMFLGSLRTDLEKRNTFADYFSRELNMDYQNARGLSLVNNIGVDYFHSIGNGFLSNAFLGVQFNNFGRDYEWRSFYPTGVGIKDGKNILAFTDITLGVTLAFIPNFRILPKYVLRNMGQQFNGTYLGAGVPSYYGSQEIVTNSISGLLGAGFEYDLNADTTLFADFLFYGPLLSSRGEYSNEQIVLSTGGASYASVNGGYTMNSQKIALGGSYQIIPKLRLFASLDQERMHTKSQGTTAYVISTGGLDLVGTVGQYLAATNEERIKISGIKFGVTYDLGM